MSSKTRMLYAFFFISFFFPRSSSSRINYGHSEDEMVIGWVTADTGLDSYVEYDVNPGAPYSFSASGTSDQYTYSSSYTSGQIHHTTLKGLTPGQIYYYRCGTNSSWSDEKSFVANNVGSVCITGLEQVGHRCSHLIIF